MDRAGSEIGFHTLSAVERGDLLEMSIRIEIAVRVLGIRVYVYEHENREQWRGGRLVALDSRTNDDGAQDFARVRLDGDKLRIEGSSYQGEAPAEAAPTTYWNYRNFAKRPWFSSQSGAILDVNLAESRESDGVVWRVSGDFETTLIYDEAQEWRGCRFPARGEEVVYRQVSPGPRFNAML